MNKLKKINERWKRVKTIGEKKGHDIQKQRHVIGDRHERKRREKDKTMKEKIGEREIRPI